MTEETVLVCRRGADHAWALTAADEYGNVVAFDPADAIAATVSSGAGTAVLFAPVVVWTDALNGAAQLNVRPADTAPVAPGLYRLDVTATRDANGQIVPVLAAWLQIDATTGAEVLPPTYGTYQDLLDYGGGAWLPALAKTSGYTNFAAERGRARSWLDSLIAKKWRPWANTKRWTGGDSMGPLDAPNGSVSGDLAAGRLMVDDSIRETVACKALELICCQRITLEDGDVYQRRAAYFAARANNRACNTVALIDTNADGVPERAIALGVISLR